MLLSRAAEILLLVRVSPAIYGVVLTRGEEGALNLVQSRNPLYLCHRRGVLRICRHTTRSPLGGCLRSFSLLVHRQAVSPSRALSTVEPASPYHIVLASNRSCRPWCSPSTHFHSIRSTCLPRNTLEVVSVVVAGPAPPRAFRLSWKSGLRESAQGKGGSHHQGYADRTRAGGRHEPTGCTGPGRRHHAVAAFMGTHGATTKCTSGD